MVTVFTAILFCIVYNGGYSGRVLPAYPKLFHPNLTFDISIESVKFNRHMESGYRDIWTKVTPQSIWNHCKGMSGKEINNLFHFLSIILNPGSLSSEDFLIWACLIEEGS